MRSKANVVVAVLLVLPSIYVKHSYITATAK
jgi:hypothetical protein